MDRKYSIEEYKLGSLLNDFHCGRIAVPAMRRAFVWTPLQVKECIESLYKGYPIGQFILWHCPDLLLKDGSRAGTKRVLIDGQQRLTALQAALLGEKLDATQKRIILTFEPVSGKFELAGRSYRRGWISDISLFFRHGQENKLKELASYTNVDINLAREHLLPLLDLPVSVVELHRCVDFRDASEIFVRSNATGKRLQKAESTKTKMGTEERDRIHLQNFMQEIETWKTEIYSPSFRDILCVANIVAFGSVKLDFLMQKHPYEQKILAVDLIRPDLREYIRKEDFLTFVSLLSSAGFVSKSLISSVKTVNFVFALFLLLKKRVSKEKECFAVIQRWFVFCLLTGRYSTGSADKRMKMDLREMENSSLQSWMYDLEESELTKEFWTGSLVHTLMTCSQRHAVFLTFLASQAYEKNSSLLNTELSIAKALQGKGVVRTIFPRRFLSKKKLPDVAANYAAIDPSIRRLDNGEEPKMYFGRTLRQCEEKEQFPGGGPIMDEMELFKNLREHELSESILFAETSETIYRAFIEERSNRIAQRLKRYYYYSLR